MDVHCPSPAALAALLLCAAAAASVAAQRPCELLADLYRPRAPPERAVSVRGVDRDVVLYWSNEPSRAAAALLYVALRHTLRYSRLLLEYAPPDFCQLSAHLKASNESSLAVVAAAAWSADTPCAPWRKCNPLTDGFCGLGGPELVPVDKAAAPLAVRAYVRLARPARRLAACARALHWDFYVDVGVARHCSFLIHENSNRTVMYVAVPKLENSSEALHLIGNIIGETSAIYFQPISRIALSNLVHNDNTSFLFLDWKMWKWVPGVQIMSAAGCRCGEERGSVGVLAASESLSKYAPQLFDAIRRVTPEPEELREVLELDTDGDIENAACNWTINHQAKFDSWVPIYRRYDHFALTIVCNEDPDFHLGVYNTVQDNVSDALWELTKASNFFIDVIIVNITCSEPGKATSELDLVTHSVRSYRFIGVVAAADSAAELVESTAPRNLPLVLYDPHVAQAHVALAGVADLAAALRHFFADCGWTRVAIVSEQCPFAKALTEELHRDGRLKLHNVSLRNSTDAAHEAALLELQRVRARVVLLNTAAPAAAGLARMAAARRMCPDAGYAWVAREWAGGVLPPSMRVFSVSSRRRQAPRTAPSPLQREWDARWPRGWPMRAASMADAILTLGHGYLQLVRRFSWARDDPHRSDALSSFSNGISKLNESGVGQDLRYVRHSLLEPRFFIHEWSGNESQFVAAWRMRGGRRLDHHAARLAYPDRNAPHDGRSGCILPAGDPFLPHCNDFVWLTVLLSLLLLPFAVAFAWRALLLRLAKLQDQIRLDVLGRRERSVQALAGCLVPRNLLELRDELGAGRSGRVHLALLRAPGRALRAVAAKSLRDGAAPAEESEFLREACTLAALDHEHVVRLVGVCTGDPLLVLMEHAFFGDLLRYLRARRHLAEEADFDPGPDASGLGPEEAVHVSAQALTRLVRQAASALAYLALRGIVHRDVRAANCLVDARRSLKLGDFGMARETSAAGEDGSAEYACRRRGMFPVLWMAPESLSRGAFSAASDVWALGVLLLEVVTLGARPYGSWAPVRVLQWVAEGGRPRLPAGATAQARGLAQACWRREARERPRACDVVAYLAEHPRALRPAPACAPLEQDAVDSGYGEPDADDGCDGRSPDSATAFIPQ